MTKRFLPRFAQRMLRRGETGQTIVILAFGFVVLLCFVGIVTDVSLMFVRYSTLRRAVDAAAVAAAGQMRRAVPDADELARAAAAAPGNEAEQEKLAFGFAYARNIANVNLAARQFIELYGLSPSTVLVDTCATLPSDPELLCGASEQPRKLVRVTAQVDSPTAFLHLIGWDTVKLEATAISETAVLDVVMILDVSESMVDQTTYADWETKGLGVRYAPPRIDYPPNALYLNPAAQARFGATWSDMYVNMLNMTHEQLYAEPLLEPTKYTLDGTGNPVAWTTGMNGQSEPREECTIRYWPAGNSFGQSLLLGGTGSPAAMYRSELTRLFGSSYPPFWSGFVPVYSYFGCCNDPDGNWRFDDLVCQPFQDVRESTLAFLERIDFNRGDRVALVTFDRGAFIIDPDGSTGPQTHMITSQDNAENALENIVGVRAELNFYADTDNDGFWDHYVTGGRAYNPGNPSAGGTPILYTGTTPSYNQTVMSAVHDNPVKDNCYLQNAAIPYPRSLYSSPPGAIVPSRYPTTLAAGLLANDTLNPGVPTVMQPNLNDNSAGGWSSQFIARFPGDTVYARQLKKPLYSYELAAGCAGGNIGAALREANNALTDVTTIRINGAVWVMVLLSDGAAGASDPVYRGSTPMAVPNLYANASLPPVPGQYGAFGVCPYGLASDSGADKRELNAWEQPPVFPYCSDAQPESRHFCFDPRREEPPDSDNVVVDLLKADALETAECENRYDPDDFARDWADFVGLEDPFPALRNAGVVDETLVRTSLQLPIIFTIGFDLRFESSAGSDCANNVEDCLGEELLRYIADVGDNQQVDTDYQQDLRDNKFLDWSPPANDEAWGDRGKCEGPIVGPGGVIYDTPEELQAAPGSFPGMLINPLPPGESCGQYYNAPSANELGAVFDDIASRMFTRLTR